MATYKIKGERWLRKYTAASATPAAYATASDAATIADTMCTLPWELSTIDTATMTSHSTEDQERGKGADAVTMPGLDWNVEDRDNFDAAVWCAEHTGGAHRAYAQAACYKIRLPDMATYPNITSLKVTATSDPYNKSGLRIHFVTGDTDEIPTACATVRNNDSTGTMIEDGTSASGAAPRTLTNSKAYTTTASVTLTPTGTVALKKYLFLFVCKENYAEYNGTWLDGSGFIRNQIELTTDAAITGWTDGATIDVSEEEEATSNLGYAIEDKDFTPVVAEGGYTGLRKLTLKERGAQGLMTAYRTLLEGGGEAAKAETQGLSHGASWRVKPNANGWEAEVGMLVVPFANPNALFTKVKLTFDELSMTSGAKYRVFMKDGLVDGVSEELMKTAVLWDGVGDLGDWVLLGEITSGTTATFGASKPSSRYGTIVIVGWIAPESVDTTSAAWQGTGAAFRPKVELV